MEIIQPITDELESNPGYLFSESSSLPTGLPSIIAGRFRKTLGMEQIS